MDKLYDKVVGSFIGLAVGDALGTSVEFEIRDTYVPVTEMRGGGYFNLNIGEWTDDTSMALALADSLIECKGLDEIDLLKRFSMWYKKGSYSHTGKCFDIGRATIHAITRFGSTGQIRKHCGSVEVSQSGNGCIMRISPTAMYYLDDKDAALVVAENQSMTTHASPLCIEYSKYMVSDLIDFYNDKTPQEIWNNDMVDKPRNDVKSTGFVVDTYDAAKWAVQNTDNFKDAVLLAVNLGDDADTVGAVTGQLAGAIYGLDSIPEEWVDVLAWKDYLYELADGLYYK